MPPVTSSSSGTPVPIPRTVILFTLAYLLPTISLAVLRGNGEFIYYSVIMVILVGVVLLVHLCSHLSPAVLWGLSLWGLLHMGGGLVPIPDSWPADGEIRVLYSWWLIPNLLKYDQVVHAYGFGVTTFVCWQGLTAAIRGYYPDFELKPTLGVLVLCSAASMGFGGLNEVLEFIATLILAKTNVGGYVNTGWDLVSNLTGAVLAACWIRITKGKRFSDRLEML